jgi:hypothetical protein
MYEVEGKGAFFNEQKPMHGKMGCYKSDLELVNASLTKLNLMFL